MIYLNGKFKLKILIYQQVIYVNSGFEVEDYEISACSLTKGKFFI